VGKRDQEWIQGNIGQLALIEEIPLAAGNGFCLVNIENAIGVDDY